MRYLLLVMTALLGAVSYQEMTRDDGVVDVAIGLTVCFFVATVYSFIRHERSDRTGAE